MRPWLFILLVFIGSQAFANVAVLRSGDHENFTRLVIAMPVPSDFVAEETANQVKLTFQELIDVRLDQAFDRITRERVRSVAFADGALVLTKACPCDTAVFTMGDRLVVIDVYDEGSDYTQPPAASTPRSAADSAGNPASMEDRRAVLPPFWKDSSDSTLAQGSAQPAADGSDPAEAVTPREMRPDLPALQQQLAADIGLALTQGNLTADPRAEPSAPQTALPSKAMDEIAVENDSAAAPERQGTVPVANIRTSGAIDTSAPPPEFRTGELKMDQCAMPAAYDVSQWDPGEDFGPAVAKLRRHLVGEFDILDEDMALSLARTYVFFGFGAEALAVVSLAGTEREDLNAAGAIAQVLEYGASPALKELVKLECGGPVSLWSALSFDLIPEDVVFDEDAAIRHLRELPKHLRRIIAPQLSMRLRARGSLDKAALVMREAGRAEGVLSAKGKLEDAQIKAAQTGARQSEQDVRGILAEGNQEAPRALISFINQQVEKGDEISAEIALLAESFALQFRGTEIERDLIAAQMIALAKSTQFDAAFALLYSQTDDSRSLMRRSVDTLFDTLAETSDDVTFLKYAVLPLEDRYVSTSERVRMRMAERGLDIGFVDLAERLLLSVVEAAETSQFVQLKSRLLLEQGRAFEALDLLAKLDLPDETAAVGEAYFAAGAFDAAAEVFAQVGADRQQFEAAYRSGSASVEGIENADVVQTLRRVRQDLPEIDTESLEGIAQLIEASEAARSDIGMLLGALPSP